MQGTQFKTIISSLLDLIIGAEIVKIKTFFRKFSAII